MIQELLEKYGIFILVIGYLLINVYLRNLRTLVLFLVTFIAFYQTVENKTYALIIAYLVSILFSIVKNFHLLENFKSVPKIPASFKELKEMNSFKEASKKPEKDPEPHRIIRSKKKKVKFDPEDYSEQIEMRNDHLYDPKKNDLEIQEILSDSLVKEFLEKIKQSGNVKVKNKKMSFYKLKPVIAELDGDTVSSLKNEIMYEASNILKKSVVISSDNYIIDGHYTWYLKGVFLSMKDENTLVDYKYTDSLNVVQIDLPIEELISRMKNYKMDYNVAVLSKFSLDKNKMNDLAENIRTLKSSVKKLEEHYVDLSNVKLV
jgi:hypothetical protein